MRKRVASRHVCSPWPSPPPFPPDRRPRSGRSPRAPGDVATIDGMISAFYEVVSGPKGQPRDWARDRTLYIPDVRFVPVDVGKDGRIVARISTHQQFVDSAYAARRPRASSRRRSTA